MSDITKIVGKIWTADIADATRVGTSSAYLGIAGREFVLDTPGSDLQQGQYQEFVFGQDANVSEAEYNDPRKPQLTSADLDRYPACIRYAGTDGWCLERATVVATADGKEHVFDNLDLQGVADNRRIWLRNDYGTALYLRRTSGSPARAPVPGREAARPSAGGWCGATSARTAPCTAAPVTSGSPRKPPGATRSSSSTPSPPRPAPPP
ncbi:hypothetical protein [Streptomyces roseolus]|uniref:hypothetical protein n=1 Tax=Streptomyces roseolus TaxID=67358 RepID=UPI0016735D2D|nr:hypothetical protein [Streptomyces roseolus]GGR41550.1 hypothetical protein GCM10010282_37940 [Streptomyces roseolus]